MNRDYYVDRIKSMNISVKDAFDWMYYQHEIIIDEQEITWFEYNSFANKVKSLLEDDPKNAWKHVSPRGYVEWKDGTGKR